MSEPTQTPLWWGDVDDEVTAEWEGLPCCPKCHLRYGTTKQVHDDECR